MLLKTTLSFDQATLGSISEVYVDKVSKEQPIAKISPKVDEDVVSRVSKGNEVQVKVSAYPENSFFGEVDEISLIAERDNGKAYFPLTIRLTGLNGYLMRIGSSAKSKIIFNKHAKLLSKN